MFVSVEDQNTISLKTKTYEIAKQFAGDLDVYFIESEWRKLLLAKDSAPKNPDGSFINFVKWYVKEGIE